MSEERFTVDPERYAQIARFALWALVLIVLTGTAVRVTGSGLGCPTWPKCTETSLYTELSTHGVIEFGNRMLTFLVGFAAFAAFIGALRRRPYRKDLVLLGATLPLGVLGQAILGGMTVRYGLAPEFVMSHYLLSMLILIGAVALDWRARRQLDDEPVRSGPLVGWGTRAMLGLGAITIFAGTAATAAGPHAGASRTGEIVKRLDFKGSETLNFVISQHSKLAAVLGVLAVALWLLARRRGATAPQRWTLTVVCVLLGVQGVIGGVQYKLELPAEMVWVHVALAAATWVAILRAVAAAGRPQERAAAARGGSEAAPA